MKLICQIFGHKIVKSHGDCFHADSEKHCRVQAEIVECVRGDYWQMLPHKHILYYNDGRGLVIGETENLP